MGAQGPLAGRPWAHGDGGGPHREGAQGYPAGGPGPHGGGSGPSVSMQPLFNLVGTCLTLQSLLGYFGDLFHISEAFPSIVDLCLVFLEVVQYFGAMSTIFGLCQVFWTVSSI